MLRRILLGLLALFTLAGLGLAAWLYTPDAPRAALEERWAAPPSQFLEVAGVRLHLRDTGPREAPAILLLHGFGSSLHTWDDVAAGLEDGFRVLRFDIPGFGLTGPDPTGDYSDARSHAVMIALLDRLGITRAHVLGSSMGGRIAWTFAASHPERVDHLVLMAPDGFASPGRGYNQPWRAPLMVRALPFVLPRFMVAEGMRPAYANPAAMTDALVERYHAMLIAPGVRDAIIARMEGFVLPPPEPMLRAITAPTLLLWGAEDGMVPASNAADYLREMRDARSVVLPGVGHVPMEEAPDQVVAALRDFLPR